MRFTTSSAVDDRHQRYHADEAVRIQAELRALGPEFADDGIVKFVLRRRVLQERERSEVGCLDEHCTWRYGR